MEAGTESRTWPLVAIAVAPIRPESPCGDDISYDDDYLRMKAVVDALSSASDSDADFAQLVEIGERVLASRSKDLRVASFLALGLERTRGSDGLAEGIAAIDALVRTHWDDMFPPARRMTGRQNALQLLSDRLKDRIAASTFAVDSRQNLKDALGQAKSLQSFTLEAMEDRAPALSGLVQALEEALRKLPEERPETPPAGKDGSAPSPPVPAGASRAAPAAAPAPSLPADFQSMTDVERAVERVATFLRERNAADPTPYLLLRELQWGSLTQLPPNEGGKTLIPPIPDARRSALNQIAASGDSKLLLQVSEEVFLESPLLLDAQRFVTQALDGLGAEMLGVRTAIELAVAVLLRRVQGLAELRFNDGTPFADGATQAWIESRVAPLMAGEGEGGGGTSEAGAGLEEAYAEALEQLNAGSLQKAIGTIQRGAESDAGDRDRFRRRLLAARLCMTARQFTLARPMLEGLDAEIERYRLAEWEPGLAIEAWKNLHRCLGEIARSTPDPEAAGVRQSAERVFDKICRVDAGQALALIPTSG